MNKFIKKIKIKSRYIIKNIIKKLRQRELKRQSQANMQRARRPRKENDSILITLLSKTKNTFNLFIIKIKDTIKLLICKIKGEDTHLKDADQPMMRSKKFKYNFNSWIRSKRGIVSICIAILIIVIPIVIVSAFGQKKEDQTIAQSTDGIDGTQDSGNNVISLDDMFSGVDTLSVINNAAEIDRSDIKPGITSKYVAELQEKLMDLGYMDSDQPTEYYGQMTRQAVTLFQREHGLTMDGCAGEKTWEILLSGNALPYTISIGVEGTDVAELQSRLVELGYMVTANGKFGTETQTAVNKFQQRNGLPVDGKIGQQTKEALYSEDVKANAISYGEKSDLVKTYQQRLKALGYLTSQPDGNFGDATVAAVKKFQSDNGIIADGYVGPTTKEMLMSPDAEANVLKLGNSGDIVTNVQNKLKSLNYLSSKNVTGYYGSVTESAVKAFQKRNSLTADGKVGASTMAKLFSSSAKKAASSGGGSTNVNADVSKVQQLISVAKSKLGCRYVWGAKGPNTFDCSGYVHWCLNQIGLRQGYLTSYGWRSVTKYPKVTSFNSIQAGDVIVFNGHVGLAIGGGQMINASSSSGEVVISSLGQNYWREHFICAFRVL